jgi:hypothetical protein
VEEDAEVGNRLEAVDLRLEAATFSHVDAL